MHELPGRQSFTAALLGDEPRAGRAFDLGQIVHLVSIIDQPEQDRIA